MSKAKKSEIIYFPSTGPEYTSETVKAACRRADELGIKEIVVATTTGRTALEAAALFPKGRVIAVGYHSGRKEPFDEPLPAEAREKLEEAGARIVNCGHALSGAERALDKVGGWAPLNVVASTLRIFGQGTKVAVEIVLMAADAGVLSGGDVVAVGGSGQGADTALVISPAHQNDMFSLKVKEIVCKPFEFSK